MVRLPGPDDIQSVGVARPRVVSPSADDFGAGLGRANAEQARAVQNIGQSITNIAQIGNELLRERQDAEDRVFLDTFDLEHSRETNQQYLDAQASMPSGGEGFTSTVDLHLQETPEQIIQRLQERGFNPSQSALDAARSGAMRARASVLVRAQTWEHNQRIEALGSRFDESVDELEQMAMASGDAEEALARLYESADAYSGVIPAQALDEATQAAEERIVQGSVDGLIQAGRLDEAEALTEKFFGSRTAPGGDAAADLVTERIIAAESGGDPNAANPRSSASGLGQFVDATWIEMVRANRPDHAEGKTDAEIIALKSDGDLSRQMTRAYARDNAQSLEAAGFDSTPGNIYLAHFAGPEGARKILEASPETPVAQVLGQNVVDANPFLAGMNAGQLRNWAANRMGSGGDNDPLMADAGSALQNYDRIDAARNQITTARSAQERTAYSEHKGQMELGILTGSVVSEQTILGDPVLTDSDKATLLRSFRSNQEQESEAQAFLRDWSTGTARDLNPYDSADRGLIDKAYDELLQSIPEEQRNAASAQFIADTGVIPRRAVADVRNNLMSNDVAVVRQGMEQAAALFDAAPRGLDAAQNGAELVGAATMYDELVNERGYSAEEAAQRLLDSRDPEQLQRREVLADRWRDESDKFEVQDVLAGFGDNWLPGGPVAGLTPEAELGLASDYLEYAEEAFVGPAQGDTELARRMALDEMKRIYGVSEVTGQQVVMRFPPENFYPAIDGSQAYIRTMAMQDAATLDPEAQNVMLLPATETAQDIRAGRMPRYDLWYQGTDGTWEMAPQQFMPDPEQMRTLSDISSEQRRIRFEIEQDYRNAVMSDGAMIDPNASDAIPGVTNFRSPTRENLVPNYAERMGRIEELDRQRNEMSGITLPNNEGGQPTVDPGLSERIAPGNQAVQ